MAKKSGNWHGILTALLTTIPSILNIARNLVACVECEVRMAKRGLVTLAILFIFAVALTVGVWLCTCAIVFIWLQTWLSMLATLTIMLVAHLLLLIIVGLMMARAKDKILFSHTRELFH